jgi:hypothetical protein
MNSNLAMHYFVEMPLIGSDQWFTVARCDKSDHAAEVVRILCEYAKDESSIIRIRCVPDPSRL